MPTSQGLPRMQALRSSMPEQLIALPRLQTSYRADTADHKGSDGGGASYRSSYAVRAALAQPPNSNDTSLLESMQSQNSNANPAAWSCPGANCRLHIDALCAGAQAP